MKFASRRFGYFHPCLTFSGDQNDCFISPSGESRGKLGVDASALFEVAREAYQMLMPDVISEAVFDHRYKSVYIDGLDMMHRELREAIEAGEVALIDGKDRIVRLDLDELQDYQVLAFTWQAYSTRPIKVFKSEHSRTVIRNIFLFNALKEVDNALIGLALDNEAVVAAIEAANSLSNAMAIESGSAREQEIRREMAYRSAMEKLRRDPKQQEKGFVRECWNEWQQNADRYKTKAAFAKDMLTKCDHLSSQKKIEDWCREWEKETSTQLAQ